MKVSNILRIGLSLVIGCVFVWLVAKQINYNHLVDVLSTINYLWLVLACMAYGVEYVLRIARWQAMLATQNPTLSWRHCSVPLLVSYAINATLPFRAGDAVRCFGFNARLRAGAGVVLATIIVERILDFLVIIIILGIALSVFHFESLPFIRMSGLSLIFICILLLVFLLFPRLLSPFLYIARKALVFLLPKHEAKFSLEFTNVADTLVGLSKSHTMTGLIGYSLAVWIMEGFVFLFVAQALPTMAHPEAAFLALPIGTLATLIPSTPGYIGTFDYFIILSLEAMGNTNAASVAYAMIVHLILWVPPLLLGGIYLLFRVNKKLAIN